MGLGDRHHPRLPPSSRSGSASPPRSSCRSGGTLQNAARLAAEEINAKGGALGRKLEVVVADETENPEQGIAAIKKLTADDKVDVLIGGYTSGVTLAQLPHISNAKTIYLGVGAASPSITREGEGRLRQLQIHFPRVCPINAAHQARALVDFINGKLEGRLEVIRRSPSSARTRNGFRTLCRS